MQLRAKIDHLVEQLRFLLLVASDIIHISELKNGIRFASQAGREFAEAVVYGRIIESSVVQAVLRKGSLQFLMRMFKGLEGDKAIKNVVDLSVSATALSAVPPHRSTWRTLLPLTSPNKTIDMPSDWDECIAFYIGEDVSNTLQALVNKSPSATPEKGVTQLSINPNCMRVWSFDGRSVTAHEVKVQADDSIEVCLPNHFIKKAIQGEIFSPGYLEICRSGDYVRLSRDGRTLIGPLVQPPAFRHVLGEVHSAPEKATIQVNQERLKKLCQDSVRSASPYLNIVLQDGYATLYDSTQLVEHDAFRVPLRSAKKIAVGGRIAADVNQPEPTLSGHCLLDARTLLVAIKPFADRKSIQLVLIGHEAPSLVVVRAKAEYPYCIVPTPKLLGQPGPCTVQLVASSQLRAALHVMQRAVESPAQKHVWLTSWAGQLLLSYQIDRNREYDHRMMPVSSGDIEVDGHVHDEQVIPLSPTILRQLDTLSKEAEFIEIEYNGEEVTVGIAGTQRFTETVSDTVLPSITDRSDTSERYGACNAAELARAMDEVLYARDALPGVNNALALVIDRRTVTIASGTNTRRAQFRFEQKHDAHTRIQALIPKSIAEVLAKFLLGHNGLLTFSGDGKVLHLSGDGWTFALFPHLECEVVTGSSYAKRPGSQLFTLSQKNVSRIINAIDAARSNERSPTVRLWYDEQRLHIAYGDTDGPALSVPVEVERGFVRNNAQKVRILGEDLKAALLSTRAYGVYESKFYLDIKGQNIVEVGRIGHTRACFEIAQVYQEPFPLRERVDVYAAIGTHFDLIRKSHHDRILTTYHGLPPDVKEHPERFETYRVEQGLDRCLIMLDNGAFGMRDGTTAEVASKAYIEFLLRNEPEFSQYTMNDAYSDTNAYNRDIYVEMVRQGLDPIYIFHLREPLEALEKILRGGYGFTPKRYGWGGAAVDAAGHRIDYVAYATELIMQSPTDLNAIKIHGFGMTQWSLMQRYPFDSVDSSSLFTWAMHYKVPTPWGIFSLKSGHPDSAFNHPLQREIVQWVRSLSYRKGAYQVDFSLEEMSAENGHGLELRQLYGLALYNWIQTGFRYIDHLRDGQCFIAQHELEQMGPYIRPETALVARPNTGVLNPIKLTI